MSASWMPDVAPRAEVVRCLGEHVDASLLATQLEFGQLQGCEYTGVLMARLCAVLVASKRPEITTDEVIFHAQRCLAQGVRKLSVEKAAEDPAG